MATPLHRRAVGTAMLWVLVILLGASACSLAAQARPVVVRQVTPAPAASQSAGSGASTATPRPLVRVMAYFVQAGRLVAVDRFVPAADGAGPALAALAVPLTPEQSARGVRSALPARLTGWHSQFRGTVVDVSVPTGFDRLSVAEQVLALAQIVFTVTANTYATGVELVHGSRPVQMPDQDGQLVPGPLQRADYAKLAPT